MGSPTWRSLDNEYEEEERIQIRLYKGVGCSSTKFDSVISSMDNSFNQAYSDGYINGYEIMSYDCTFDRTNWPNKNMQEAFETWLQNHDYTKEGLHLVIHDQDSVAPAITKGGRAYDDFGWGHVSIASSNAATSDRAVHHALHGFVSKSEVGDLINDGIHDLGANKEYSYYGGYIYYETPFGDQNNVGEGNCSNAGSTSSGYTDDLTECTKKGLSRTEANYT